MLSSTLAAAVGVQSQDNRERDFSRKAVTSTNGCWFAQVFVIVMVMIVQLVLGQLS